MQQYPEYLLWNRRKTLTGSPDPTRANGTNRPCKRQGQEEDLLLQGQIDLRKREVYCVELYKGYSPYCFRIRRQHSTVHPGTRSFQVCRISGREREVTKLFIGLMVLTLQL